MRASDVTKENLQKAADSTWNDFHGPLGQGILRLSAVRYALGERSVANLHFYDDVHEALVLMNLLEKNLNRLINSVVEI